MKTNPHSLKLIQEAIRNDPNGLTLEPWAILDMIEDLLEFHSMKLASPKAGEVRLCEITEYTPPGGE